MSVLSGVRCDSDVCVLYTECTDVDVSIVEPVDSTLPVRHGSSFSLKCVARLSRRQTPLLQVLLLVQNTALLQWISEYSVQAYTTPDNVVLYLNHAQIAYKTSK